MKVILLAAGLSSRLTKGNKLTLPLPDGTTVLERAIRTAGCFTQEVWVVTGHDASATTAIAEANGAQSLYNPDYMQGQETSLRKALTTLPGPMLVCPADLYLLTEDDYRLCAGMLEGHEAVRPVFHGQIGHPAGLSARFVEEYRKEAYTRVKTLMERLDHRFYEAGESAVRDVDTDEDFKRMLEELGWKQDRR